MLAEADEEPPWAAAIDGSQGLAVDGSPVQMLNVILQQVKLTLDPSSIRATAERVQWRPSSYLAILGFSPAD